MTIDLPLAWMLVIGFAVMMYVITDGFDLGIGILFPFVKEEADRDAMVNTVAPVWDGNETWLVLGGAGLFAAKQPTLMFNGYAEEVAHLYSGMDLRRYF